MDFLVKNNRSGKVRWVEAKCPETLFGSGHECDVVLEGDGVRRQHARFVTAGHHNFLKTKQDGNGEIAAIYRETLSEHGTNFHWDDEIRIDRNPFEVGVYTIRIGDRPKSWWRRLKFRVRSRLSVLRSKTND